MARKNVTVKPGQPVPRSGQYIEVGPRGGQPSPTEKTLVKDKTTPPTSAPGRQYKLVDPTKHKND